MPSLDHEALVELFRNRPTLAAELLREAFGQALPIFKEARIESADLAEVIPADRRADLLVVLVDEQQKALQAIVVEVQLGPDSDKPYIWPVYITHTRARHRCPTWLLVVTIDPSMVRWCSRPIDTGHPGWVLTPTVLGPEGVPVVTAAEMAAATPELAVLSALAHGESEEGEAIGRAFIKGAVGLDEKRRGDYLDLVLSSVNEAVRRRLEEMLRTQKQYRTEFARSYKAEGRQEGLLEAKAQDVLAFLEARGLEIPGDIRERILGSTDLAELDRWIRRAAVVSEARELFSATAS